MGTTQKIYKEFKKIIIYRVKTMSEGLKYEQLPEGLQTRLENAREAIDRDHGMYFTVRDMTSPASQKLWTGRYEGCTERFQYDGGQLKVAFFKDGDSVYILEPTRGFAKEEDIEAALDLTVLIRSDHIILTQGRPLEIIISNPRTDVAVLVRRVSELVLASNSK